MTMRAAIFVLLAGGVALPSQGADLLEVYELARRQAPDLVSARAAAGAAAARYRQARGALLPQLTGEASFSKLKQIQTFDGDVSAFGGSGGGDDRDDDFEDQQSLTLNLNQALFDWPAWQARNAADARTDQAERERRAAAGNLIVGTARAYFDVLAADAALQAARRQTEVISRQLDRAKAAFESGLAPVTDVQQAQSELDAASVDVITADNEVANSRDALTQLTGRSYTQLVAPQPPFAADAPPGAADAWVDRALAGNPELAARRAALAAAQAEVGEARGGHLPTVNLTSRFGESEQTLNFPGVGETTSVTETMSVGIQLTMPLFAGLATSARVDETQFVAAQSRQDLIRSRRQITVDAQTAFRDARAAAARVAALKQAIASGETAVQAAEAGLVNGTRNILDVLEAETDLIERRVDLKEAWYDFAVGGLRLKQAAGSLQAADVRQVNVRLHTSGKPIPEPAGKTDP